MNRKYKLLALDLDGTLLDDNKRISPSTFNAIINLQKEGYVIVLASGRPTFGVQPYAAELRLAQYGGYILSYNGGKVTSCIDNAILVRNTISLDLIPRLYQITKEHGLPIISYRRESIITEEGTHEGVLQESQINNDMDISVVEDFVAAVNRPPFKCAVLGDPRDIAKVRHAIESELGNRIGCFETAPGFLDIVPYSVDKAKALDFLLTELGMDRSEVIAVGDSYNDVGMIQIAGLGVAMANATEAVKQCADYITKSNTEDGVAHLISKYITHAEEQEEIDLDAINALAHNTLMHSLGIRCTHLEPGRVEATMPVDIRTRQPMGILHGGASLALAETVAGFGSVILLDEDEMQVGMQVSGNHISSAHEGEVVKAIGTIIHKGKSSHVWNVDITTQGGKIISTVRVVNSILRKR